MPKTTDSDAVLLAQIEDSLAEDVLTDAYSDAEIDTMLRDAGGDPETIGRRGAELVKSLQDKERLTWRESAQAKRDAMKDFLESAKNIASRSIAEIREYVRAAQSDPALAGAFHKRNAAVSSDDELRSLAEDIEKLRALASGQLPSGKK